MPQPSTKPANNGISTPAKIGIGIGVPVGVVLLCLIAYLIGRHGRHGTGGRTRPIRDTGENAELEDNKGAISAIQELGTSKRSSKKPELQGDHIPSYSRELEGSRVESQELALSPGNFGTGSAQTTDTPISRKS